MNLGEAKHAFITGGASGIGLGIADALARRGLKISIADFNSEAMAKVIGQRDGRFQAIALDVRDREGWALAKQQAEAAFGPVDILVNNAGIAPDGSELADMTHESFDRVIAINLVGVFNGIASFAADIRARGKGHIVNTASMAGLVAEHPGLGSYGASKAAVVAISEVLRREMAPHGVGVSVLCPGMVATNLLQSTLLAGGRIRNSGTPMVSVSVEAPEVGEIVAEAISRNLAYIITHPARWEAVERRFEAIGDCIFPDPPLVE